MTFEVGTVLAAGTASVGAVLWLFRLHSQVQDHDRRLERNETDHDDFMKRNDKAHDEIKVDLRYVRERMDVLANGHWKPKVEE